MLYVKTPEEVLAMIESEFAPLGQTETAPLSDAPGRILAEDAAARCITFRAVGEEYQDDLKELDEFCRF